jgi:hypothetical protein
MVCILLLFSVLVFFFFFSFFSSLLLMDGFRFVFMSTCSCPPTLAPLAGRRVHVYRRLHRAHRLRHLHLFQRDWLPPTKATRLACPFYLALGMNRAACKKLSTTLRGTRYRLRESALNAKRKERLRCLRIDAVILSSRST